MSASPQSMLRIVSEGLQDIERLNAPRGRPSIQFYTSVLRRRTRWSRAWRRVEFDGLADFGRTVTVTLPIMGELITRAVLVVQLPALPPVPAGAVAPIWTWTNSIGNAICSDMVFSIGSTTVDTLDSRLMEILTEHEEVPEHFDSTNTLLGRYPSGFSPATVASPATELAVIPPFWWNRGVSPHALPIQALSRDKVQIHVTFREAQQCVYTESRTGTEVGFGSEPESRTLPLIAWCPFVDASGNPVPGAKAPGAYHFVDAYWLVEYVSLEDREATAIRLADLHIPIVQHRALPAQSTGGARQVRVPIATGGLVRDMVWVAQRVEAPSYNNYFLFSRDLHDPNSDALWWPDARIPDWNFGDGYFRPAFVDRQSDPIVGATLWTQGTRRFEHDGPSIFRSLIPALGSQRTPWVNRYIYRYDFGMWPTGKIDGGSIPHEHRGSANWDLIQQKELVLDMAPAPGRGFTWSEPGLFTPIEIASGAAGVLQSLNEGPDGFRVLLFGATPTLPASGAGVVIACTIDMNRIQRIPGYLRLLVRCVHNGSAALVAECVGGQYVWLAVAAGGGVGGFVSQGGDAAPNATQISFQGGTNSIQSHDENDSGGGGGIGGGGGGGMAPLVPGPGLPLGGPAFPTNNPSFVTTFQYNGGGTAGTLSSGGDGYYGGGIGSSISSGGGGGGGSYISSYIEQVTTYASSGQSRAQVAPLTRERTPPLDMNIYVWLTRWNMMRVQGGRGVILFSD